METTYQVSATRLLPVACITSIDLSYPSELTQGSIRYLQFRKEIMTLIIDSECAQNPRILALFTRNTPQQMRTEAHIMIETIMRLYYARHNFEMYDPWIAFTLTIVGNTVVSELSHDASLDPTTAKSYQSTLILSAQGLYAQSQNCHMSRMLALQLELAMKPEQLRLVQTYSTTAIMDTSDLELIKQHTQSHWPVVNLNRFSRSKEIELKDLVHAVQNIDSA